MQSRRDVFKCRSDASVQNTTKKNKSGRHIRFSHKFCAALFIY